MPLRLIPRRDRQLNRLVKAASVVECKKKDLLYTQGDRAKHIFIPRSGHMRLTTQNGKSGNSKTVAILGPNELFGTEAITLGNERLYTAIAGSDCELYVLKSKQLVKALRKSPATLRSLLASQGEDLAKLRAIVGHSGAPSRARIAHVLLDLGCRLGHDNGRRIYLGHWFTHQEIADLAGVHRSTVTTAINDWIYQGVLKQSLKNLVINKPGALRKHGLHNTGDVFRRRIVSIPLKSWNG